MNHTKYSYKCIAQWKLESTFDDFTLKGWSEICYTYKKRNSQLSVNSVSEWQMICCMLYFILLYFNNQEANAKRNMFIPIKVKRGASMNFYSSIKLVSITEYSNVFVIIMLFSRYKVWGPMTWKVWGPMTWQAKWPIASILFFSVLFFSTTKFTKFKIQIASAKKTTKESLPHQNKQN